MHIDLWADVACPWCYLGIRHLRAALAQYEHAEDVEVVAHAYFLDPELSEPLDVTQAEYLMETKGVDRETVEQIHSRLSALGDAEGVVFDFDHLIVAPTSNAHRVIAAAREYDLAAGSEAGPDTTQLKVLEAIDRAHFEIGLDISDPEVLIGCGQDVGMAAEDIIAALADETRAAEVFSDFQIAVQMGVDSVPTLLIDRQFVVQGAQPVTAISNALDTAWEHTHQGDN